jgi:hypothetical protein
MYSPVAVLCIIRSRVRESQVQVCHLNPVWRFRTAERRSTGYDQFAIYTYRFKDTKRCARLQWMPCLVGVVCGWAYICARVELDGPAVVRCGTAIRINGSQWPPKCRKRVRSGECTGKEMRAEESTPQARQRSLLSDSCGSLLPLGAARRGWAKPRQRRLWKGAVLQIAYGSPQGIDAVGRTRKADNETSRDLIAYVLSTKLSG